MTAVATARRAMVVAAAMLGGCGAQAPVLVERGVASDASLLEVDLGWHAVGAPIALEVPVGALGVTVVAGDATAIGFESLRRPDGIAVVEQFALAGVIRFAGSEQGRSIALALPQSDASMPPAAGAWQLVLGQETGDRRSGARLTAWVRLDGGDGADRRIDVNLFAAASTAPAAYLRQVLALAFDGFAGMHLGDVSFRVLDDDAGVVDDDDEAQALLAATRDAQLAPAVNVVAVADMSGLLGAPSGRAGGVPGLGCVHGTNLSGLLFEVSGDPDADAARLRHETGHLAGLFHTSDSYGLDPLGDTAECTNPDDLCPDAGNVMFPRASATPRSELTAAQTRVVLGSTLYRAD